MASREGQINSVVLKLRDLSFLWEMSLMIIASTNGMASGILLLLQSSSSNKDQQPFPPSIMPSSVKLKGESPCGQKPLTLACEFLPQRFFSLMVISGSTICKEMHQLPYSRCPGMLRSVQRQKHLEGQKVATGIKGNWLFTSEIRLDFNTTNQDNHLKS